MARTFDGSTALVTGATSGIGRAVALQLAELGAEVVVHGRSAERGAKTVQDIQNAGGSSRFVAADLSDPDDVRRLAAEAGPVDILINNAGIYKFVRPPTPTMRSSTSTSTSTCAPPTSWYSNWCREWPNAVRAWS